VTLKNLNQNTCKFETKLVLQILEECVGIPNEDHDKFVGVLEVD
jgi:hypothetical protein